MGSDAKMPLKTEHADGHYFTPPRILHVDDEELTRYKNCTKSSICAAPIV